MREDLITVLKAQQWEICKGHLNALWALTGAVASTSNRKPVFENVQLKIEQFIEDFEGDGLHE